MVWHDMTWHDMICDISCIIYHISYMIHDMTWHDMIKLSLWNCPPKYKPQLKLHEYYKLEIHHSRLIHEKEESEISLRLRLRTQKRHTTPRPFGRTMEFPLWVRKTENHRGADHAFTKGIRDRRQWSQVRYHNNCPASGDFQRRMVQGNIHIFLAIWIDSIL